MLEQAADIATIVGSIAVVGVTIQAFVLYKQLKADHERGRREKTVQILTEWFARQNKEGPISRKIVESFSVEQCREILLQQEVRVSKKLEKNLVQLFPSDELTKENENGHILLTESQAAELRWHIVSYLNSLETVLIAWQYSVVDREIIEHQFSYLFRPSEGHEVLKEFRVAAGGEETFPAIEIFVTHIQSKKREKLISKGVVA